MSSPELLDLRAAFYQDMTSVPHEVVQDILTATDYAYAAWMESPGGRASKLKYDEIKQSPNCIFVADQTSQYLNDQGYQSDTSNVYFPRIKDGEKAEIFHLVSVLHLPDYDEPVIADGTWQQFLPHRTLPKLSKLKGLFRKEVFPDVLIGTSVEIAKIALGVGFNQSQSQAWQAFADNHHAWVT